MLCVFWRMLCKYIHTWVKNSIYTSRVSPSTSRLAKTTCDFFLENDINKLDICIHIQFNSWIVYIFSWNCWLLLGFTEIRCKTYMHFLSGTFWKLGMQIFCEKLKIHFIFMRFKIQILSCYTMLSCMHKCYKCLLSFFLSK